VFDYRQKRSEIISLLTRRSLNASDDKQYRMCTRNVHHFTVTVLMNQKQRNKDQTHLSRLYDQVLGPTFYTCSMRAP
jgi:CRISPR/Cas system-associated exonuclease Cas4 (RecB family)